MYPNVGVCNLDVAAMLDLEAVVDVVYNPDKTELILRAEEAGVPVAVGGLEMLVAQAVYAAEYFLDRKSRMRRLKFGASLPHCAGIC